MDVKNDRKSISSAIHKISKLTKENPFEIRDFKKTYISKSPSNQIIGILKNIV